MSSLRIFIYWILLIVPTIAMGILSCWLLYQETERLKSFGEKSVIRQAQAIADNADLYVSDVKNEMMAVLTNGTPETALETLSALSEKNPLIKETYLWTLNEGLVRPSPGSSFSTELLPALYNEKVWIWDEEAQTKLSEKRERRDKSVAEKEEGLAEEQTLDSLNAPSSWSKLKSARQQVRSISQEAITNAKVKYNRKKKADAYNDMVSSSFEDVNSSGSYGYRSSAEPSVARRVRDENKEIYEQSLPAETVAKTGWHLAIVNNAEQWVGFCRWSNGTVTGVVLNSAIIAENLNVTLPEKESTNAYYEIRNPENALIANISESLYTEDIVLKSISIGRELPGWTVRYTQLDSNGGSLFLLGSLFIVILIAAILLAGSLLLLQANKDRKNALLKTTFVSNVSHELKTPLTTIRMYAEMLTDGLVDNLEKRGHYLETLVSESERLTRLVNNVLDFSRIEQKRRNYHPQKFNLSDFINSVTETQRIRIEKAEMELHIAVPDEALEINADRDALGQVIINLIDNAIKYACKGGYVSVNVKEYESYVAIVVEDRGHGISPKNRKRIFENFHRIDESITTTQPGCGLGLSISKHLISELGGSLTCSDASPHGTKFTIQLPV